MVKRGWGQVAVATREADSEVATPEWRRWTRGQCRLGGDRL